MKRRIPILDNLIYAKILFSIRDKEVYASELVEKLKKPQSVIIRQLRVLVSEGYLEEKEHPEKKKNIKLFFINWEKLRTEFIKDLKKAFFNPYNSYTAIAYMNHKDLEETRTALKQTFKILEERKELTEVIRRTFSLNNLFNNFTLRDFFIAFFHYFLIEDLEKYDIKKIRGNKERLEELIIVLVFHTINSAFRRKEDLLRKFNLMIKELEKKE